VDYEVKRLFRFKLFEKRLFCGQERKSKGNPLQTVSCCNKLFSSRDVCICVATSKCSGRLEHDDHFRRDLLLGSEEDLD